MLETIMKVTPVETAEDIKRCYKVMHQLRPHLLDETAFVNKFSDKSKTATILYAWKKTEK